LVQHGWVEASGLLVALGDGTALVHRQHISQHAAAGQAVVRQVKHAVWALLAVAAPAVAMLSLALMRPGKGLMIAVQMRNKMDGVG
jgi:uncharacterized protein (DUF983 family)